MSTLQPALSTIDPRTIYDDELREQLRAYYDARDHGRFWKFNFDKAWIKFQRGVRQESDLADLVSRWVDFKGANVLVIGSYMGSEAIAYALRGAQVVGIDLDENAMVLSRVLAARWGVEIDVRAMDAVNTTFPDASFDYVSCAQVLEHVPPDQQPKLLAEIWRLLKPGGAFWLDTPNQLAIKDHHDTGLPFIHWLPRSIKVPLARAIGRDEPNNEPAFGNKPVYLHYYVGYFGLKRILARLGSYEILSRYRGYADPSHYAESRKKQGRGDGLAFPVKVAFMRVALSVWNMNWMSGIRMVIRKLPQGATP